MIPYMVCKLAPTSSYLTRGLVKCVPGRRYFRAVSSLKGDKFVTSPPPPIVERLSGPALALVLHLPVMCGSRTPGLEFRCRIVSREEGYCVSWVPLGVERVACMTAACLKTLALTCLTKLFW